MADELTKATREQSGTAVGPALLASVVSGDSGRGGASSPIGWFGPGNPLSPVAPDEVAGRAFDYPTHYNLAQQPRAYDGVTFGQLRALADGYDLLRLVIETRKDQIESYAWEIRAKEGRTVSQETVEAANLFFQYPDQEHPWGTWMRMLLEDVFVIDAACVYPRLTRGGQLYGLELMDGGTIKRVLDASGRTPLPPDPAYQQVLKGLPAVDYTREELIYWMRNPRTNKVYGYSPVEQIIMTVNIAIRRQLHQLEFYTEGSVPEAIAGVPDTWNMDTLVQFQQWWDSLMEGNTAARRHMKFVPLDPSKIAFPKQDALKDQFDEWLARIICFAFSISPTALVKETNRATAESVQDAAKREGLIPLLNWLKQFLDYLLAKKLNQPNLEFNWTFSKDLEPLVQAQVDQIYVGLKALAPSEIRERQGMPPMTKAQMEEVAPPPPPATPMLTGAHLNPGQPAPTKDPGEEAAQANAELTEEATA